MASTLLAIDPRVNRGDDLGPISRALEVEHPHAAHTDLGDAEAGRAQRSCPHEPSPSDTWEEMTALAAVAALRP
jgi:hypothetical protein